MSNTTDYEKVKNLLKDLNVEFLEKERKYITLCTGFKKVIGYTDFETFFEFDKDGNFVQIGIYE